jgi:hypothetical protein
MIVVTRVQTLWSLAESLHPLAVDRFEHLRDGLAAMKKSWISESAEELILKETYSQMPEFDFSRDLLAPGTENCLIVPLEDVTWNDLGRPERMVQVLERTEHEPNFPLDLLKQAEQRT